MRLALAFVAVCGVVAAVSAQEDVVKTAFGPVRGLITEISREFRGVPYAAPPVNGLRWKAPQSPASWGPNILDTTQDKPQCVQDCQLPSFACSPAMSEDCLYLNVFTPRLDKLSSPVPVLLFIHGGNFKQGYAGGLLYNSSVFANYTNTVIVVIQYRLGALGFLHLPSASSGISGNYGLFDQRLALQWTQQNIAAFGGDPKRVTVFGQSAGAMSIATHLTSPNSKGLFQNAILESEPFGLPFRTASTWEGIGNDFIKYSSCNGSASVDDCLMAADAATLLNAQVLSEKDLLADASRLLDLFLPWTPTVGSVDVPYQPIDAWVAGKMWDVPMIIGTVHDEAWEFVYEAFGKPLGDLEYEGVLAFAYGHLSQVNGQYPQNYTGDNRPVASQVATDSLFHCATRNASLDGPLARSSPVYLYRFNHVMSFSSVVWANQSYCVDKVCHGEDLPFVFGNQDAALGVTFTAGEVMLRDAIQTFWSNMAKSGNPNQPVPGPVNWPEFNAADETMVVLDTPAVTLGSHLDTSKCVMWNAIGYNFA